MKKIIIALISIVLILSSVTVSANYSVTMYAPDGRTINVYSSEVSAYKNVGWYDYPVDTIYAPDGRSVVVAQWDVEAYKNVGWYTYPVVYVYNSYGGSMLIAQSDISYWAARGWYQNGSNYSPAVSSYQNIPIEKKLSIAQTLALGLDNINFALDEASKYSENQSYSYLSSLKSYVTIAKEDFELAYSISVKYSDTQALADALKRVCTCCDTILNSSDIFSILKAFNDMVSIHKNEVLPILNSWSTNSSSSSGISCYSGTSIPKYDSVVNATLINNDNSNGYTSYSYMTTEDDAVEYLEYLENNGWAFVESDETDNGIYFAYKKNNNQVAVGYSIIDGIELVIILY